MADKITGANSVGYMSVMSDLASTLRKKRLQNRKASGDTSSAGRGVPQGEAKTPILKSMDNPLGDGHLVSHVPEDRHVDTQTTLADPETRASPGVLNPPRPEPGDRYLKDPVMNYQKHEHGATKAMGQSGPDKSHDVEAEAKRMTDPKMGRDTDYHGSTLGKGYSAPTDDWKGQNSGKGGQFNKGGDHSKPDDSMWNEDVLRGMLADLSKGTEKQSKPKASEPNYRGNPSDGIAKAPTGPHPNPKDIQKKAQSDLVESKDIGHMIDPGHYIIRDSKKGYKLRRK